MGANAQTSVPLFTAGEVLTAANQNLSAGTGVPVFATTTTRDAAFGGTGEKVLAEGQLCYIEASDVVQYYNGTAWATVGPASASALTLVKTTTIGTAVSTVAVTAAFSSTYENYLVTISGGVGSTLTALKIQLGSTTTGYYGALVRANYATAAVTAVGDNNATSFTYAGWVNTDAMNATIWINSPQLAKRTALWSGMYYDGTTAGSYNGQETSTTQHTDFTVIPAAGTLTGGTIRVYGLANS